MYFYQTQDKSSWQNEQEILTTTLVDQHENVLKHISSCTSGAGVLKELWLITEFHEKVGKKLMFFYFYELPFCFKNAHSGCVELNLF